MASAKRRAKPSREDKPGVSRQLSAQNWNNDGTAGTEEDKSKAQERALAELRKWKKDDVQMWINDDFGASKTIIRKIAPNFKDGKTLEKLKGKDLKNFLENKCKIYSSPQRKMISEGLTKLKRGLVNKHLKKILEKKAAAE